MNERVKDIMQQAKIYHADSNGKLDVVYERIIRLTVKECINEISQHFSTTIFESELTEEIPLEQREEWAYIKGINEGYNDCVKQIADGLRTEFGVE